MIEKTNILESAPYASSPEPDEQVKLPSWVKGDEVKEYFVREWGRVPRDSNHIFEQLSLLVFQLGLEFRIVLRKRNELVQAFHHFDIHQVAEISDEEISVLCQDSKLIRNVKKITACRDNARVIVENEIDLPQLFNDYFNEFPLLTDIENLPKTCAESVQLSKHLSQLGTKCWGPTVICSAAQALGYITVGTRTSRS